MLSGWHQTSAADRHPRARMSKTVEEEPRWCADEVDVPELEAVGWRWAKRNGNFCFTSFSSAHEADPICHLDMFGVGVGAEHAMSGISVEQKEMTSNNNSNDYMIYFFLTISVLIGNNRRGVWGRPMVVIHSWHFARCLLISIEGRKLVCSNWNVLTGFQLSIAPEIQNKPHLPTPIWMPRHGPHRKSVFKL